MRFSETPIAGVFIVDIDRHDDERGFFARTFDRGDFVAAGLTAPLCQFSVSFNRKKGTLRGMHYQAPPSAEVKLVRCTRGAIHDVVLDLRSESPTYRAVFAVELSAHNHRGLYIPEMVAHGFQTLTDNTEVFYQINVPYVGDDARGVRYDDPAYGITWPLVVSVISVADANRPFAQDSGSGTFPGADTP